MGDRNVQIIEVPAHNNIVHSRTIFDFRNGKLIESSRRESVLLEGNLKEHCTHEEVCRLFGQKN